MFGSVSELLPWREPSAAGTGSLVVDLQGVKRADSAGLALILEWIDLAGAGGNELRFANLPESLARIAALTNLDSLIPMVEKDG